MLAPSQRRDLEEIKAGKRDAVDEERADCWVYNQMGELPAEKQATSRLSKEVKVPCFSPPDAVLPTANSALLYVHMAPAAIWMLCINITCGLIRFLA